ncbi:MAG: sigma-54 dependent transcriptional regulator [Thermodesulfobacteriota bacterium]
MKPVLVAAARTATAGDLQRFLEKEFFIEYAPDPSTCLEMFRAKRYEFTFMDLDFLGHAPPRNGHHDFHESLKPYWQAFPTAHIIVMSGQDRIREAVAAVKAGVSNYLTYPLVPQEVDLVIENLSEQFKVESELEHLRESAWRSSALEGAMTNSPVMAEVLARIRSVAATKTTVLLTGETGSGKGVLARLIHSWSNRADGPFIAVHCGAIPDTLLESEFFGHEKGSFTGAVKRKLGKFQIADGGTVFLDEIGTITPAAQIKMLQVLQEKKFTRVGGEAEIEVDIRLIAATNMDLKRLCDQGLFRKDLYYRLNVFPVEMPSLRDRREDIPLLLNTFLERLGRAYGKTIKAVAPEVMEALVNYSWPGNIREMENVVERAFILEKGHVLNVENFPREIFEVDHQMDPAFSGSVPKLEEVRRRAVEQVERRYLRRILTLNKGRIDSSAAAAGVTARQVRNLLVKYSLHKEDFK